MKFVCAVSLFLAIMAAPSSLSAKEQPQVSAPVSAVVACRSQTNEEVRLRCYDAAVAALAAATAEGSVLVVDREEVRKARRGMFGFALPKIPFFSGDKSQDEEPDEIAATIASARPLTYGKWQLDLAGAGVWQTTDPLSGGRTPRSGDAIKVKKGTFGSYFLTFPNGRSTKGLRVR